MIAGRTSPYTEEAGIRVCELISCSTMSLAKMHKLYPDWFPTKETVLHWRVKHPEFYDRYINARKLQAELTDEEIREINERIYEYTYIDSQQNPRIDSGAVAACQVHSRNSQWLGARQTKGMYIERMHIDSDVVETSKIEMVIDRRKGNQKLIETTKSGEGNND